MSNSSNTLASSFSASAQDEIEYIVDSDQEINRPPLRLPELVNDRRLGLALYRAALKGDWDEAEKTIKKDPTIVRANIALGSYTALHVAAGARHAEFVQKLIEKMEIDDLRLQDERENTAFCVAAAAGSLEVAKILVRKDPSLPELLGTAGKTPLYLAALFGHEKMAFYLYSQPASQGEDLLELFFTCIETGLYGLASIILKTNSAFAFERDDHSQTALHLLAKNSSAFTATNQPGLCTKIKHWILKLYLRLIQCNASGILRTCAEVASEIGKHHQVNTVLDLLAHQNPSSPTRKPKTIMSLLPTKTEKNASQSATGSPGIRKRLQRWFALNALEKCPELVLELDGNNLTVSLSNLSVDEEHVPSTSTSPGVPLHERLKRHANPARALLKDLLEEVMKEENSEQWKDILISPSPLLFMAVSSGNSMFVAQLIHENPDLIWETNDKNWTIIHAAVKNRNERIFSLIYEIGLIKDVIATFRDNTNGNTLLHLAAELAPADRMNTLPGAAFQIQRELLWFEEVKKIMQPFLIRKNQDNLTAQELFTAKHEDLLKEGRKWMNGTARSCTITSTLVSGVLFAAGISVSLGGNQPLERLSVKIFIISDAVACLLALAATLTFLAILTSPYAERDFLEDLPNKLKAGLVWLFFSIIAMVVAFSTAFFIAYGYKHFVPISITIVALGTVVLFVVLQAPLFRIVFGSASSSESLFKQSEPVILLKQREPAVL